MLRVGERNCPMKGIMRGAEGREAGKKLQEAGCLGHERLFHWISWAPNDVAIR